ncbi:MAG: hypothetical protein ABI664_00500 [bacterium]
MHRLGRALALVTQLVLFLAPLSEGREQRLLGSHVEAPRTLAHPGHRADFCAECVLLSVHGRAEVASPLPELPHTHGSCHIASAIDAQGVEAEPSNSSRAPPSLT